MTTAVYKDLVLTLSPTRNLSVEEDNRSSSVNDPFVFDSRYYVFKVLRLRLKKGKLVYSLSEPQVIDLHSVPERI